MIKKHRGQQGVSYYVYVTDRGSDRKRYVGSAPTKEAAQVLERQRQTNDWEVRHGLREVERTDTFERLATPWVNARGEIGANGQPRRAAWRDDVCRMNKHILPYWGDRRIVDCGSVQLVREFVREREKTVSGTTLCNVLRLLSRFFNELPDDLRRRVPNPVRQLDRADRPRLSHDPKDTPFLEDKAHICRLLDRLPSPVREIYAVCVLAGLRPGEARALYPDDVNLGRRSIHLQRAAKDKGKRGGLKVGTLKDHESRIVPIGEDLLEILRTYILRRTEKQAASEFLFPALRDRDDASGMVDAHTLQEYFHTARKKLRLPKVNFYQASRHTFASHYVIDGGSIERLSKILGHSSVLVTERYAHLRADHFTEHDLRPMLGFKPERGLRLVSPRSGPAMAGTHGDAATDSDSGPSVAAAAEASEAG
jgi:integrase